MNTAVFSARAEFDAWNWKTETLIVPSRAPHAPQISAMVQMILQTGGNRLRFSKGPNKVLWVVHSESFRYWNDVVGTESYCPRRMPTRTDVQVGCLGQFVS